MFIALLDLNISRGQGAPWVVPVFSGLFGLFGTVLGAYIAHKAAEGCERLSRQASDRRDELSRRQQRADRLRATTREVLVAAYDLDKVLTRLGRRVTTSGRRHERVLLQSGGSRRIGVLSAESARREEREEMVRQLREDYYDSLPHWRAELVGLDVTARRRKYSNEEEELMTPPERLGSSEAFEERVDAWETYLKTGLRPEHAATTAKLSDRALHMWWLASEGCIGGNAVSGPRDGVYRRTDEVVDGVKSIAQSALVGLATLARLVIRAPPEFGARARRG